MLTEDEGFVWADTWMLRGYMDEWHITKTDPSVSTQRRGRNRSEEATAVAFKLISIPVSWF
ncbi:hypothetical protein J28TS4_60390 [Paenibacillus lautus]|nr:hypothetical protein J28TS4_60390 [Paenibacillus lautus]